MVGIEKRMANGGQRLLGLVYSFAVYTPTARIASYFYPLAATTETLGAIMASSVVKLGTDNNSLGKDRGLHRRYQETVVPFPR